MTKIAFRHALALVQVALFFVLSLQCHWEVQRATSRLEHSDVTWDLRTDQSPPDVCQFCYAISIPAAVLFSWVTFLPDRFFWLGEIPFALGVTFLWYGVGIWRDRRVGLLPQRVRAHADWKRWVLAWLGIVVLCSIMTLAIFSLMDWWTAEAINFGIIGWSSFAMLLIASEMHAWRAAERPNNDLPAS